MIGPVSVAEGASMPTSSGPPAFLPVRPIAQAYRNRIFWPSQKAWPNGTNRLPCVQNQIHRVQALQRNPFNGQSLAGTIRLWRG